MPDRGTNVFAVIERPIRIWAVAAINGDLDRLRAVHDALEGRIGTGDRVVYLGNYFGNGGHGPRVIDELLAFRRFVLTMPGAEPWDVVFLRGAQEEIWQKLLQLQFAPNPREVLEWMLGQGAEATLEGYGASAREARQRCGEGALSITRWTSGLRAAMHARAGHDDVLTALKRYAVTDDDGILFVHAGIDPRRPLSEQGDTFWWGSGYFDTIGEAYEGFARVVRGYDRAHKGRIEGPATLSIDAGAGFGGALCAACLAPDGAILDWIAG